MERHPIGDFTEISMDKIKEMVDANTVIGESITTPDGITIIPICKVCFGLGAGGADFSKQTSKENNFGVGSGTGVTITPIAFLVIKDGSVRLMNIPVPANSTVERLVEIAPDLIDKIKDLIDKYTEKDTEI